jgi:hypothetical protein
MKTCKFCKNDFDFEKHQQFITHVANCKSNPNIKLKYEKMIQTFLNKRKDHEFSCRNCGKKYILNLTPKSFEKNKYRKFCSRSCANVRNMTVDIKEKIKNGMDKFNMEHNKNRIFIEKECKQCGISFTTINNTFCSRKCSWLSNILKAQKCVINREQISKTRKEMFKNGDLKITGGNTKWFTVKTTNGNIRVQGSFEVVTCEILDILKQRGKIKNWEYSNDRFEYINSEYKKSSYLVDFKIFDSDNNFYYLETKGYKKENDDLKWKSVKDMGYDLIVWYREDIKKIAKECNLIIKDNRNGSLEIKGE